jgi:hypothetical protein
MQNSVIIVMFKIRHRRENHFHLARNCCHFDFLWPPKYFLTNTEQRIHVKWTARLVFTAIHSHGTFKI